MTISLPNIYNLEDSFVCGEIVCHNHVLKWGTHDNESFRKLRFYKATDSMQTVTPNELVPTNSHPRMPINPHLTQADTDAHTTR